MFFLKGQNFENFGLSANSEMRPDGDSDPEGEFPRGENLATFLIIFDFLLKKIGTLKIKWPNSEEKMKNEGRLGQWTNICPWNLKYMVTPAIALATPGTSPLNKLYLPLYRVSSNR